MKCLALVLITAVSIFGADATGTWTGSITLPNGNSGTAYIVLVQQGETLKGTAGGDAGDQRPIENGKAADDTVTFETETGGGSLKVTLKQAGDRMEGSGMHSGPQGDQKIGISVTREKPQGSTVK